MSRTSATSNGNKKVAWFRGDDKVRREKMRGMLGKANDVDTTLLERVRTNSTKFRSKSVSVDDSRLNVRKSPKESDPIANRNAALRGTSRKGLCGGVAADIGKSKSLSTSLSTNVIVEDHRKMKKFHESLKTSSGGKDYAKIKKALDDLRDKMDKEKKNLVDPLKTTPNQRKNLRSEASIKRNSQISRAAIVLRADARSKLRAISILLFGDQNGKKKFVRR